jgi:hypothetical protein
LSEQAKPSAHPTPPAPEPADTEYRDDIPTRTDLVELEAARIQSSFSTPPPAMSPLGESIRLADYKRRFGGFDRIPVVVLSAESLAALSLDGRASILVAVLDGRSTIQAVLDFGVLNALDALAGLDELVARRVIELRPPGTTA